MSHLQSLLDLGAHSKLTERDRRLVRITNGFIFAFLLIGVSQALADIAMGHVILLVANCSSFLGYLSALWLNQRGRHVMARVALWCTVAAMSLVAILATDPSAHLIEQFWLFCVVPFLVFRKDQWPYLLFCVLCVPGIYTAEWILRPLIQFPPTEMIPVEMLHEPAFNLLLRFPCFVGLGSLILFQVERTEEELLREQRRSDTLLRNILPGPIAEKLKQNDDLIAENFQDVTVLFADLVGFTSLASRRTPEDVVALLNEIFSAFDELAEQLGVEKIKTIGDAYMAVGGLPEPREDHVERVALLAFGLLEIIERKSEELDEDLSLRVGIHRGQVVAGVIGRSKFSYDLWGDTVNLASRMESHGTPGKIQLTTATMERLPPGFSCEARGEIEVKGCGLMQTWYLTRRSHSPPS